MKKRIVSLFMALVMTLSLLPTTAWAVQPSPETTEQTLTEQTAEEPSAAEETGGSPACGGECRHGADGR